MLDEMVRALRDVYGDDWARDEDSNLRFSVEIETLVQDVEGLHLLGDPEINDGQVLVRFWVDRPVPDLMTADTLAFAVFGRLSEEVFYAERKFESGGLRYPFVTGSARRGHIGVVELSGPHAADFALRFRQRITGGARYHA